MRTRGCALQIRLMLQSFRLSGEAAPLAQRNQAVSARESTLARIQRLE